MTMKFSFNSVCVVVVIASHLSFMHAHYTQQWAVHIPGGSEVADKVAQDHGFINHGLVSCSSFITLNR